MPDAVHVEPPSTFFSFPSDPLGLSQLFEERHRVPSTALSIHLWAHLWWERESPRLQLGSRGLVHAFGHPAGPHDLRRPRPAVPVPRDGSGMARATTSGCTTGSISRSTRRAGTAWPPTGAGPPSRTPGLRSTGRPSCPEESGTSATSLLRPSIRSHCRERTRAKWSWPTWCPSIFPPSASAVPMRSSWATPSWETDRIPDHWIGCLDTADLVVVPSQFSADAIALVPGLGSGGGRPPRGAAKSSRTRRSRWDGIPPDVFVFYTIAEWSERKAVFHSIEAYLRAFTAETRCCSS